MADQRRLRACCARVMVMGRRFCAYGMRHSLPLWGLCLLLCAWGIPAPAGDGVQAKEACFSSTAPVQMADGSWKPIAAVRVGDQVRSRDQFAPKDAWKPATVTRTHVRSTQEVVRVHLHRDGHNRGFHRQRQGTSSASRGGGDDGDGSGSDGDEPPSGTESEPAHVLTGTAEHPVWVQGTGWAAIGDLAAGDVLLAGDSGTLLVTTVDRRQVVSQPVFNLTVDGPHTYVVGARRGARIEAVWVHNTCMPLLAAVVRQTLVGVKGKLKGLLKGAGVTQLCEVGERALIVAWKKLSLSERRNISETQLKSLVDDARDQVKTSQEAMQLPGQLADGIDRSGDLRRNGINEGIEAEGGRRATGLTFKKVNEALKKWAAHHLMPKSIANRGAGKALFKDGFRVKAVVDGEEVVRVFIPVGLKTMDTRLLAWLPVESAPDLARHGFAVHDDFHPQYTAAWRRVMGALKEQVEKEMASGLPMEEVSRNFYRRVDRAMKNADKKMRPTDGQRPFPIEREHHPKYGGNANKRDKIDSFTGEWEDFLMEGVLE